MNIVITGGTGSLGTALLKYYASQHKVTVISRSLHTQADYRLRFPTVRFILADICNYDAMLYACQGQDVLIHAAALKRIELGEDSPAEYHRVNVLGTQTVLRAARRAGIPRNLFISSDKATDPRNLYGMTKAIAERLWLEYATDKNSHHFGVLRYGNVLGSNGSVMQLWGSLADLKRSITVRCPGPTRFGLSLTYATTLVDEAFQMLHYWNGTFVPGNLPAFSVWELARTYQPEELWIKVPLSPGEKQHEALISESEMAVPLTNPGTKKPSPLYGVKPRMYGSEKVVDRQRFYSNTAPFLTGQVVREGGLENDENYR